MKLATALIGLTLAAPVAMAQNALAQNAFAQNAPTQTPSDTGGQPSAPPSGTSDTATPPAHHHAHAAHGSRASADNSADDLNAKSLADARSNTPYAPASGVTPTSGASASGTSASGTGTHHGHHHHGAASGSAGDTANPPTTPGAPSGSGAGNSPQ